MEYEETYSGHGGLDTGRDACELLKPTVRSKRKYD